MRDHAAIPRVSPLALMQEAGFERSERLDEVLFQPVLVGRRKA